MAEKRRAPLVAPNNRRDAARQSRDQRAIKRNSLRRALVTGDERAMPTKDRGPLRRYVRDWVDSKRTLSEFLLPVVLFLFIPQFVTTGAARADFTVALDVTVLAIFLELLVLTTLLRRALTRAFPEGGPGRKGAIIYGAMRLASIRKFRLPKPAIGRGEAPRPTR